MPKMKTSRAAAKRFKVTGTGKLKRNKAYKRHILTKKTTKNKRNLRKPTIVDATNVKNMKKILPYMYLRRKKREKETVPSVMDRSYQCSSKNERNLLQPDDAWLKSSWC